MDIPYDFNQFGKNIVFEETKEKKVLIKIPLNDGYWTKEYNKDDQILDLIKDFKEENQLDISRSLLNKYLVSGIDIDANDNIQALLNTELFLNNFLNKKFRLIGKPFNNPFEVFVFDKTTKILNVQTFNVIKVNSLGINHYGPSSSYCNGNNHLYISGGETNSKQLIDKFYDIDLESKEIDGPYDMSPKANHSMIYISPNKVFIVGGNDLKTFYFDIRKRKIVEWADLKLIRIEPALQIFKNTLYCFDNVNKNNNEKLSFEKTDLSNADTSWELIEPNFAQSISSQKLAQKFFAVSKDITNENIIFLGGNMDESENSSDIKNYKYNPDLNNIEITDIPFRDFNYKEKTFLFYNKNVDYLLPDFNRQHPEVTFYVKNKSRFEKVNYLPQRMPNQSINIIPKKRILLKYNFDMPNKENIGKNLKTYININNQNNSINEMKIPNIGNINIQTDLGIPKVKPYELPEIQPNLGDKQINLQIPPKIIGFNKHNFEEEKNAEENQDFSKNLKISVNPEIDGNFNLLGKSKQNLDDSKIQINVEVDGNENNFNLDNKNNIDIKGPEIQLNNDIIDMNIHQSVDFENDGLELLEDKLKYKAGELTKNYEFGDFHLPVKQSLNINEIQLNQKNIENPGIPEYNSNIDLNIDAPKIKVESPEVNVESPNIKVESPEVKVEPPKVNIKMPEIKLGTNNSENKKEEGININTDIKKENLDININTGDKKKYSYYYTGLIKGKDFDLKKLIIDENEMKQAQDIHGSANINIRGPKLDIDQKEINNPNLNYNLDTKAKVGEIKTDIKMPEANLSGNIPNVDLKGPNLKIDNPNINIPDTKLDVNINKPDYEMIGIIQGSDYNIIKNSLNLPNINKDIKGDININGPKVEISSPEIEGPNLKGKNININKPDINLNLNGNLPEGDISAPKVDIGNLGLDINGQIPGVDINKPKVDMNINSPELNIGTSGLIPGKDFEMNGKIKGLDNKIEIPKINLEGKAPDINVNMNGPEFKKPDLNYNMNGEIKAPGLNIDTPNTINTPKIEVSQNIPGIDIKGPKIDINKPIIELSGVIRGADFDKYKDLNIEVPNIDSNIGGGIDLKGPKVEISSPNIEGPDVKLKGKKIDIGNPNVNAKLDVNLPETEIKSPNIDTGNIDANIKGSIPKVELNGPKIDIDNKLNLPDANINVNAPNVKIPENYSFYQVGVIKGKDFELTGLIKDKDINGSANLQMKGNLPNIDIKGNELSKPEFNYNIDGKGIDIKGDVNIPNGNISGNIHKLDVKGPSMNVEAPSINAPKVEINKNIGNVDIKGPNINIDKPEIFMSGFIPGADFNFETKDLPNINSNVDLNVEGPKIKGPNIDLKGKKLDINKPEINVEGNIFDAELKNPKIDITKPDVNLDINKNINKADINVPDLEIKGGDIKSPDVNFELGGIIPSDNLEIGNSNLKGSRRLYDYNINKQDINLNTKPIKLDNYQPNLELKGSRKLDVSLNKNIEGKIPSINLNGPNLKNDLDLKGSIKGAEISEPNLNANINMPSVNIPNININSKNDFEMTGIIKGVNYQNLDLDIKGPKADINLKKTDVDIKGPSVNIDANTPKVKGPNIDIKAGYDFYTDGTIVGAEDLKLKKTDKNIDINLAKPKIDIKSPEIKIDGNIKKPEIDINNPELKIESDINKPKIDINNPKINIEGNNNQIKIPDINLNGANINVPGVELDTNMKNINIPSGDINIKENIDIKAPKIEIPSGDVKLNAPNIKGPNINITGDSKNLNFNGPELNANLGDIKIKNPKIKADANLKVDDVNINNKLKSEINPGKVNIKLDLPKNKENYDYYLEGTILGVDSKKEKEEKEQKINISKNLEIDNSINLKGSRRMIKPEYSINSPNVGLKTSQIRIQQPEINLKGSRRIDNYNPNINDKIKGSRMLFNDNDIPENTTGIKIKPPTIEINPGNININENSKNKIEGTIGIPSINANIENKNDINIPAPGQMVNIEIKKYNLLSEQNNDNIPPNNEGKNSINDLKINMPQINVNLNTNIEGNEGKINKTYINKRGNALPKVGNKETGFKASKVEKGGKFDTDNVNTELLKNVNVGVGGVKMGERIEE